LTTNVEYPGIMALLRDSWGGRIAVVDVGQSIGQGDENETLARLNDAVLVTRPSVLFISHVVRSSGFVIPNTFFTFVREVHPPCVVVVDGAQAVGNIRVDSELIADGLIDFYVTSGQKWLCSRPTLALVWCHPHWRVQDPSQSYSKITGSGGTGDVRTLRSLAIAIQDFNGSRANCSSNARITQISEHNANLSRYFCSLLSGRGIAERLGPLPLIHGDNWRWNGIVSLWKDCDAAR